MSPLDLQLAVPALVSTRHEYDNLFAIYVPIAVAVCGIVLLATLFAVLRGRRRPPTKAKRWHENNALEGSYALFLTLIVAFLLFETFTREHRVDTVSLQEHPSVVVNVTAAKWEWQFSYPAYGITVRSGTIGRQPLVVPQGQAVRFRLTSLDVIHAFWVPTLDYKHDVFPGIVQPISVTFDHAGLFPGACAQFCGLRHADMVFNVRVLPPAQFQAWVQARRRAT